VADGFEEGLSFYYASSQSITIEIYDGPNGTGTLLASKDFPSTPNPWTVWELASVTFDGTAISVLFSGGGGETAFDAITLDSMTPDSHPVPISKQTLLISVFLMMIFAIIKSRRIL